MEYEAAWRTKQNQQKRAFPVSCREPRRKSPMTEPRLQFEEPKYSTIIKASEPLSAVPRMPPRRTARRLMWRREGLRPALLVADEV